MKNYIDVIYDSKERPVTKYPNELIQYLIERFHIEKGSKILDNGCGRGDFLQAFYKAGMEAYGTDRFACSYTEENAKDDSAGPIINTGIDLEDGKLPFENDFFDIVFAKSVLEHIHKPENFLRECNRVLKPGGRIIIMVPDWQSCMYIYFDDFSHVQPYTKTALKDVLEIFGFEGVDSEIFYQLPCVWKHPAVKAICKTLQLFGPVKKISKNKFYRFSRELMCLGTGEKRL